MANPLRNSEGVGAGFATNDMNTSAILEARSTTKGVLFPRLTTTQRDVIVSPEESLLIWNTTTGGYQYYHLGVWTDFGGGSTPTLQQILDNNHDLVDGNNFQGTDAGQNNIGFNLNGFGEGSAQGNTGSSINAFGESAGASNIGDNLNAMGQGSAQGNAGSNINAFGVVAGASSAGDNLNALGASSLLYNTGSNINAFGNSAGANNGFNNINLFGNNAQADGDYQTVFSKSATIQCRFDFINLTDIRKITWRDLDGTPAFLSEIPTTATDLDALKRDGSNANVTLDLQAVAQGVAGTFVRGNTVEIEGANPTKKSIISANLLTDVRNMEMPDYAGTLTTEGYVPTVALLKAGNLIDLTDAVAARSNLGFGTLPSGNLVGTTDVQVITNKDLTSGTNTFPTFNQNTTGNANTATALQTARTIGTITGDATSAGSTFNGTANNTNALTLATVNSNVGSFTNASVTVNAKGLVTAVSSGTAPVTSVTGTANRITVTGTTTPTLDIGTDVVTLTGTQTVTNKSLTSPTLTGLTTVTGTTQTGSSAIGVIDITQTLNTTGSPTIIKSNITNTASGSTTKLIDLQVGAVTQFNVTKAGLGYFAGGLSLPSFSAITGVNGNSIAFGSNGLTYTTGTSTTPTGIGHSFAQGNLNNITSGNYNFIQAAQSFTPTSGTGTFSTLVLSSTVNQTGGANGITRGIYINPTITAAADFRAFELTNNTGYALYGSGTAPNYLAGKLGLGQTTATAVLHLKAGTATANTAPLKLTSGTNLTTTEAGAVEFDGAHFYGTATNGGSRYQLDNQVLANSYSGVGTATTTFTVSIGSTMANSTYKVTVTPTSSLSAALFYVTNKTTTTFDVMYLAGLTGTVTFDWHLVP